MVLVPRLRGRLPRCAVLVRFLVFRSSIITKMSRIRLGERGLYGSFTLCTVSPQQRPFPAVVLFPNLPTGSPGEQLQSPSLRSRPRSPSPSVYVHCVYTRHHLVRMPSDLPRGRGYKYHALPFAQPASLKSRERARERERFDHGRSQRGNLSFPEIWKRYSVTLSRDSCNFWAVRFRSSEENVRQMIWLWFYEVCLNHRAWRKLFDGFLVSTHRLMIFEFFFFLFIWFSMKF